MTRQSDTPPGKVPDDQPRHPDGTPDWNTMPGPHGPQPVPKPRRGSPGHRPDARLARAQLLEQAIRMLLAGHTYKFIAFTLHYRGGGANLRRAIWRYIDHYAPRENVDQMRELEGQRLDQMTTLLWSRVSPQSTDAHIHATVSLLLKVGADRRKLWGLDLAPPDVVIRALAQDGDGLQPQREAAERGFEGLPIDERQDLWRKLTAVHAEATEIISRPAGLPAGNGKE